MSSWFVHLFVCLSVSLVVCPQAYLQSNERIRMRLLPDVCLGPRNNPLHFGEGFGLYCLVIYVILRYIIKSHHRWDINNMTSFLFIFRSELSQQFVSQLNGNAKKYLDTITFGFSFFY